MIDPDGRDAIFDVTRNKKNEIIGVTVRSTIYIQGAGASAGREKALNQAAYSFFKAKNADGVNVSFAINYVYENDKQKDKLKPGENLLTFMDKPETEKDRSHVNSRGDIGSTLDDNFIAQTGNNGEIHEMGKENSTIFHESLHFFGISDHYYNDNLNFATGVSYVYPNDIMGNASLNISLNHYRAISNRVKTGTYSFLSPNTLTNTIMVDINKQGRLIYAPKFGYQTGYSGATRGKGRLKQLDD